MVTLTQTQEPGGRRSWQAPLLEAGLAIGVALAFFAVFLAALTLIFPTGVGIRQLLGSEGVNAESLRAGARTMYAEGLALLPEVGRLGSRRNEVRTKSSNSLVWTEAESGASLRHKESVQTMESATATIELPGDDSIEMGPNTLIVLKDNEEDIFSARRRSSLLVIDGALRGTLTPDALERIELEVPAGDGTVTFSPTSAEGEPVVFRIDVADDNTSTVTIEQGTAQIQTETGVVDVRANERLELSDPVRPGVVVRLHSAPKLVSPSPGHRFRFRRADSAIRLAWAAAPGVTRYELKVAQDPLFTDLVFSERVAGTGVELPSLAAGSYYWSVTGETLNRVSTQTAKGHFRIIQDRRPPKLDVEIPEGNVAQETIVIAGRAEPGSTVHVSGQRVTVDPRGRFSYVLPLDLGPNVIVVEAVDSAGNAIYRSAVVNRKRSR